ncbi:MAG: HD domain-containing protein [Pseudomonadota bacterium]
MTDSAHPTLEETIALAAEIHGSQTDLSGAPYIAHLARVAAHLINQFPMASIAERHAVWLHDCLEDTHMTPADLAAHGYGAAVIELVEAVTRPKGQGATYQSWIEGLAAAGPIGAIRIKIADLADNSDPIRLASLEPSQAASLGQRYARAHEALEGALEAREGALEREEGEQGFLARIPFSVPLSHDDVVTLAKAAAIADRDAVAFVEEEIVSLARLILWHPNLDHVELARHRVEKFRAFERAFVTGDAVDTAIRDWAALEAVRCTASPPAPSSVHPGPAREKRPKS